jgi:hypothetical protein
VVRFYFKSSTDRALVVRFRLSPKPLCEVEVVRTLNSYWVSPWFYAREEYLSRPTDRIDIWLGGNVEGVVDVEDVDTHDWLLGVKFSIRHAATKGLAPESATRSALVSSDCVLSLSLDPGDHIVSIRTLDQEMADLQARLDALR